jgi:hypothetical protein
MSFRVTAADEHQKWTPSASSLNVILHLRDPEVAPWREKQRLGGNGGSLLPERPPIQEESRYG